MLDLETISSHLLTRNRQLKWRVACTSFREPEFAHMVKLYRRVTGALGYNKAC